MKTKKTVLALITLCSCLVLSACNHGTSTSSESSSNSTSSSTTNKGTSTTSSSSTSNGGTSTGTSSSSGESSSSSSSTFSEPPVVYYTVTFYDDDGTTVLETVQVKEGEHASYSKATPTKATDETYAYSFDGWDKDPASTTISSNTTFTAKYKKATIATAGLQYVFASDGASYEVASYTGNKEDVIIPKLYEDLPVTVIRTEAFSHSLIKSIIIPSSVTTIGSYAFNDCSSLSSITFHEGLKKIDSGAFQDCSSLSSISFPDSLESIGGNEFSDCDSNISISVGDNLTDIGYSTFVSTLKVVSDTLENGVYYLKTRTNHYYAVGNESGSVSGAITLKTGTLGLADSAFSSVSALTGITLDEGLTFIGGGALSSTGLTSIALPASLKKIETRAFASTSLTSITSNGLSNLEEIGESAFSLSTSLVDTNGLAYISDGTNKVFLGTLYTGTVTTLNSLDSSTILIGDDAISQKITSITIPSKVNHLDGSKFIQASSLTSLIVNNNPNYTVSDGALYNADETELIYAINCIAGFVIPSSVKTIGYRAFSGSSITSLSFAEGSVCESIGDEAFYDCYKLIDASLPSSLTSIGSNVFYDCGFESITIPASLKYLGDDAFYYCWALTSAIFENKGSKLLAINKQAFYDCEYLANVTLPDSVIFFGDDVFKDTYSLTSITLYDTNKNFSYAYGILIYASTGEFAAATFATKNVVIPASVTSLPTDLFDGDSTLETLVFADESKITSFEYGLCRYCLSLTSVTLPESLTSIGGYAFANCYALTSVSIPASVTLIDNSAFSSDSKLAAVTFKGTSQLTTIKDCAFTGTSLVTVTLPDSVTSIGGRAFDTSTNTLETFNISKNSKLQTIGNQAFANSKLSWIYLPGTLTSVGQHVFYEDTNTPIAYLDATANPPTGWDSEWAKVKYDNGSAIFATIKLSGTWQWDTTTGFPKANS